MNQRDIFDQKRLPDRIALLAIYMPILRKEIFIFKENWNAHRMRKQKNRPNHTAGCPSLLYFWPDEGIEDQGTDLTQSDLDLLDAIVKDAGSWGMY